MRVSGAAVRSSRCFGCGRSGAWSPQLRLQNFYPDQSVELSSATSWRASGRCGAREGVAGG